MRREITFKGFAKAVSAATVVAVLLGAPSARGAGESIPLPRQEWPFSGPFGAYDKAALQRGLQVYKEVCASCHSMNLLAYRNIGQPGALGYTEDEVKAFAAQFTVIDGPNDEGEMFERPGAPADRFVSPFPNEQAARASNGGALPPDLSLIAKARASGMDVPWGATGPDYLYALLTGYEDPPEGFELLEGLSYNKYYPGHQIAMYPPLSEDLVTYADGTPATVEQMAHDVASFFAWAAEPKMEERKQMGLKVVIFLIIFTAFMYVSKRYIWRNLH